jgi:hypothetical protein
LTLRNGHGAGAGVPRIEVLPADELPAGVVGPSGQSDPARAATLAAVKRTSGGAIADAESARNLGRLGGRAKAAKAKQLALLAELGLQTLPDELGPYIVAAEEFAAAEVERLARAVGGGVCGAAPASLVQSAALQLAASRAAFAAGDSTLGSRLANDSRQNLLAAHELCAREAKAMPAESVQARIAREIREGR